MNRLYKFIALLSILVIGSFAAPVAVNGEHAIIKLGNPEDVVGSFATPLAVNEEHAVINLTTLKHVADPTALKHATDITALEHVADTTDLQRVADTTDLQHVADLTIPQIHGLASAMPVGQATYFQAGLGACGDTNNGAVQDIVALPHGLMGLRGNDNPYCDRRIMITFGGKSFPGIVKDKCMGCTGNNIDLSAHLFLKFAPLSAGRLYGVEWHFI